MKERPILFSAPMVKALLAGTKTQTRRIVGLDTLKRSDTPGYDWTWRGQAPIRSIAQQRRHPGGCWQDVPDGALLRLCPYGAPGNQLWVRETWCQASWDAVGEQDPEGDDGRPRGPLNEARDLRPFAYYRATDVDIVDANDEDKSPWKSPIFMPRWASRITLAITEVRVQRLHDITEEDARAEGVERDTAPCDHTRLSCEEIGCLGPTHKATFCQLWCDINGADSWAANPWVWALTFKRHEESPCAK